MGNESRKDGGEDNTEELSPAGSPVQVFGRICNEAAPSGADGGRAPVFEDISKVGLEHELLSLCSTFERTGVVLAWLIFVSGNPLYRHLISGEISRIHPRTERPRYALPLRLGELGVVLQQLQQIPKEMLGADVFEPKNFSEDCWTLVAMTAINSLYSGAGQLLEGPWRPSDLRAVQSIRLRVEKVRDGSQGISLQGCWEDIESDLKSRRVNYTGEELVQCHQLTLEQILPALPFKGHGGCVHSLDWVGPVTRNFLLDSDKAILPDTGQALPKLQGKIHVAPGELDSIVSVLIEREICTWIPLSSVLYYRGQPVLNGLFGVEKSSVTAGGLPVLRLIMNLVPSNTVLQQLTGGTRSLPYIGQWLSTVLEDQQELRFWQSDMSSAFYLFDLPQSWWGKLSFNILRTADQLNLPGSGVFALCCKVIPMGFNSSVALMQELSENLLLHTQIPRGARISRGEPLPLWLTGALRQSETNGKAWYHIYLDNFCAAAKIDPPEFSREGNFFHLEAEEAWRRAGVVSSEKKRKSNEVQVEELGSFVDGRSLIMGVTMERSLKLIHATLYLVGRRFLNKKMAQIIAGRWVHVLQFRRPGMSCLDEIW